MTLHPQKNLALQPPTTFAVFLERRAASVALNAHRSMALDCLPHSSRTQLRHPKEKQYAKAHDHNDHHDRQSDGQDA